MTGDRDDLARFVLAQDADDTYARALRELRAGRKRSHWMWFVFPQLAGLGRSSTARHFALDSLAEARAYLADPVLGSRLRECARAALDSGAASAIDLLGDVDALKLHSSATLFDLIDDEPAEFRALLTHFFGGTPDGVTLDLLSDR